MYRNQIIHVIEYYNLRYEGHVNKYLVEYFTRLKFPYNKRGYDEN